MALAHHIFLEQTALTISCQAEIGKIMLFKETGGPEPSGHRRWIELKEFRRHHVSLTQINVHVADMKGAMGIGAPEEPITVQRRPAHTTCLASWVSPSPRNASMLPAWALWASVRKSPFSNSSARPNKWAATWSRHPRRWRGNGPNALRPPRYARPIPLWSLRKRGRRNAWRMSGWAPSRACRAASWRSMRRYDPPCAGTASGTVHAPRWPPSRTPHDLPFAAYLMRNSVSFGNRKLRYLPPRTAAAAALTASAGPFTPPICSTAK